jgi:hypothetical protein
LNSGQLSQARLVLKVLPKAAEQVARGALFLNRAHEDAPQAGLYF